MLQFRCVHLDVRFVAAKTMTSPSALGRVRVFDRHAEAAASADIADSNLEAPFRSIHAGVCAQFGAPSVTAEAGEIIEVARLEVALPGWNARDSTSVQ